MTESVVEVLSVSHEAVASSGDEDCEPWIGGKSVCFDSMVVLGNAFAAMNDAILLHVKIGNWNLLWYAGIAGITYSIGKSLEPTKEATRRS